MQEEEDLEALIEAPFVEKQDLKQPENVRFGSPKDERVPIDEKYQKRYDSREKYEDRYRNRSPKRYNRRERSPRRDYRYDRSPRRDNYRDDRKYSRKRSPTPENYRRRSPYTDKRRKNSPSPQKRGLEFEYKEPEKKENEFVYEPYDYTLTAEQREKRTIFVYHLSIKTTEKDVAIFFKDIGKIRDVRLIKDRFNGKSKGFGYVEFVDPSSVQLALGLTGQMLDNHAVMIKASEAEKNVVGNTIQQTNNNTTQQRKLNLLYVRGIPPCLEDDELKMIFESLGEVVFVSIERKTNEESHEGWVKYKTSEDAKKGLCILNHQELGGGFKLEVGIWNPKKEDDEAQEMTIQKRALMLAKLESEKKNFEHASPCLLLSNMFDPSTEQNPNFDNEIKEEVSLECENFGKVLHCYVDKFSKGNVYIKFDNVENSKKAHSTLHGRYFNGKMIVSSFIPLKVYKERFPDIK